jgi:hypothetical protein
MVQGISYVLQEIKKEGVKAFLSHCACNIILQYECMYHVRVLDYAKYLWCFDNSSFPL